MKSFPMGWYIIAQSTELKSSEPLGLRRFGTDLALWRDSLGTATVMEDRCPHRSVKLSLGQIKNGNCLECPFHGLLFDKTGLCQHVPETGKPASGIAVRTFPTFEEHGFIWVWFSSDSRAPGVPPKWFEELPSRAVRVTITEEIDCHVTRCIENQLDYAHLGIVHSNSIGRGFNPRRQARFLFTDNEIQFFLSDPKSNVESKIEYRYPNIWINKIIDRFMITLAFVPIDDNKTKIYLTSYQTYVTFPIFGRLIGRLINVFNLYILKQDSRIVNSHPRGASIEYGTKEILFFSDKAVRHFRQIWTEGLEKDFK